MRENTEGNLREILLDAKRKKKERQTKRLSARDTENGEKGEKYRKSQKTRQSNKGNYREIRTKKSIIEEIEYIRKGQQMNFQLPNQSHRQSCA